MCTSVVCIALSTCMMETAECGETASEHNQEVTQHKHMNFSRNQVKPIDPNSKPAKLCSCHFCLTTFNSDLGVLGLLLGVFMDDT